MLATSLGLYATARTTAAFSVERVDVEGAPAAVADDVRRALAPAVGESLLGLDLDDLSRRVRAVPMVASASFDRAFPHTLAVAVTPEQPVGVLRQGSASWLVAASGRVVAQLDAGVRPALPRIWLKRDVDVRLGESVRGLELRAVTALAPLADDPLPVRVASVVATKTELTFVLRSGLELRLGNSLDLPVKLEVARTVLAQLSGSETYLDVGVPERPVAGETLKSKVEVETTTSMTP